MYIFSSKLHIPANIGTAAAPGEVPTGKFVSVNNGFFAWVLFGKLEFSWFWLIYLFIPCGKLLGVTFWSPLFSLFLNCDKIFSSNLRIVFPFVLFL